MIALARSRSRRRPGTNPSTGIYRYYAQDLLGSTRSLFDGAKLPLADLEFMPYGELRVLAGNAPEPLYTGKPYDPESGLYFFPFRYYSPVASRWLTRDPLGMVDGPNVYGYVGGNPENFYDPRGALLVSVIIGGLVGCLVGWLTAEAAGENGRRGAACGCLSGAVAGSGGGWLLGSITSAIGGFLGCACENNWSTDCWALPAITGGVLGGIFGTIGGWLFEGDIVEELMEGLGLAFGATIGSATGDECCEK